MPIPFKKVFLIILDGFGLAGPEPGNAILQAGMPYLESLIATYPSYAVEAAGLVVGLPWGNPGNSEVGHSAIGTGRIVIQDLARINEEIRNGDFYKNPELMKAVQHAKQNASALHLIGCTSPGGIHSHVDHLIALLELAHRSRLPKVFVHFIADGQDMPPQDAVNVLQTLKPFLKKAGGRIASVQGRSYAMDRVNNWKLTERVWHAIVLGDAPSIEDPEAYIRACYAKKETDYAIEPATVTESGKPVGPVSDGDAVVYYDFRNDRARQLATPFILGDAFTGFDRVRHLKNVLMVTMTKYAEELTAPFAYPAPELPDTLGQIVSDKGWHQWRIAEKEKEAHVTNFFNGGRIPAFPGESRDIVSSRMMKGHEYVEHPEMSAQSIVDSVLKHSNDDARMYVINFANPDMIGHTGDLQATERGIRITDDCLKQLVPALLKETTSAVIITADHGNAEELIDPLTGGNDTQHSTRNVPVIFAVPGLEKGEASGKSLEVLAQDAPLGTLVDIAPSVLYLLGSEKPSVMTGSRLVTVKE